MLLPTKFVKAGWAEEDFVLVAVDEVGVPELEAEGVGHVLAVAVIVTCCVCVVVMPAVVATPAIAVTLVFVVSVLEYCQHGLEIEEALRHSPCLEDSLGSGRHVRACDRLLNRVYSESCLCSAVSTRRTSLGVQRTGGGDCLSG